MDLVAEERAGGYCAIQVKCYAPKTRIAKQHLDSFISASARAPFTAHVLVDTGDCALREWVRPAELARWVGVGAANLTKRYLGPLTERGLLERRYPESPATAIRPTAP